MNILRNEEGFVLITGLMILMVLTLLGLAATTNTSIELQIAGNDRLHKQTFYSAEAGALFASELLEQNLNCETGFSSTGNLAGNRYRDIGGADGVRVWERDNDIKNPGNKNKLSFSDNWNRGDAVKDGNWKNWADASYPVKNLDPAGDPGKDDPETGYLYLDGYAEMLPGGNLLMAAGYEGPGKGAGGGGVAKIFNIYSRFRGELNSESIILFGWRHVITAGGSGACKY